jgi:hypothetical protein
MELQGIERLNHFKRRVVLPVFRQIQQDLEALGYGVQIAEISATENKLFDERLIGLVRALSAPFLEDAALPLVASKHERHIVAALTVQFEVGVERRFCLGVEGTTGKDGAPLLVSMFHENQDGSFSRFQTEFTVGGQGTLREATLLQWVMDYLAGFQVEAVNISPEAEVTQPSESVKPAEIELKELDKVVLSPAPALAEIEDSKRALVRGVLERLGLERSFNNNVENLRGINLDRMVVWSRNVVTQGERGSGAYQDAYEVLLSQAVAFTKSRKSIWVLEFADYFELYCTLLQRDDLLTRAAVVMEDEAAFIGRVKAAGETDAPERLNGVMLRALNSLMHKLAAGFGQPNEFGRAPFIGVCEINHYPTMEPIMGRVQDCAKEGVLRFERLSWGMLQVYQNAGLLPLSERYLGHTLVLRFWRSARLTIERPTRAGCCVREEQTYFEFEFEREIVGEDLLARARVMVSRKGTYAQVALLSYGFERI